MIYPFVVKKWSTFQDPPNFLTISSKYFHNNSKESPQIKTKNYPKIHKKMTYFKLINPLISIKESMKLIKDLQIVYKSILNFCRQSMEVKKDLWCS